MNRTEEIINLIPNNASVLVIENQTFVEQLKASKKVEVHNSLKDISQDYYDVAVSINFLDSLPLPEQIINGIRRALKPSGVFYAVVDTTVLPMEKLVTILNQCGCAYAYELSKDGCDALFTIKYKPQNKSKRYGLAIGILAMETVPTKWWLHMQRWVKTIPGGVFWNFIVIEGKYYDVARQEVVQKAYNMGVEWLFFLDSDVFPPEDCLQKLLSYNKPIVTGVYWMKTYPPQPVVYKTLGNGPIWDIDPTEELVEIGGSGLGCSLINMEVFDHMQPPYFKCNWDMIQDGKKIHSDIGEDHYFYIMAKKAGYKIYMAPSVLCDHWDTKRKKFFPDPEVIQKICGTKLRQLGASHLLNRLEGSVDKKKRVVFFTSMGCKFNGDTIKEKAIAGSETAVIHMAQQMARLGHDVQVYCNCDKPGNYNGIKYTHYGHCKFKEPCDLFISSRCVDIFYNRPKALKTVLWCHDMPVGFAFQNLKFVHRNIDLIMGVSQFHKNIIQKTFPFLSPGKVVATTNGLDLERFKSDIKSDRKKLVYATTPFRGLDVLLKVWPKIHSQVPDAELYIYSSMKIYQLEDTLEQKALYELAKGLPGVHYSEPIKQGALAKELQSAGLYVYPNHFDETSCIACSEAITALTPVVSTNAGALPETVGDCGILIKGTNKDYKDSWGTKYQEEFIKAVVKLLTDDGEYNKLVDNCKKRNFSWDLVGDKWNKMFFGLENINRPPYWDRKHKKAILENDISCDRKKLWQAIIKYLPDQGALLDYGCGLGYFLAAVKENNPDCIISGYDFSGCAMDKIKEMGIPTEDREYDVITAINLIECLDNPGGWIKLIKQKVKKKGKLIITITQDLKSVEAYHHYDYLSFIKLLNKHFNSYKLDFQEKEIIAICSVDDEI